MILVDARTGAVLLQRRPRARRAIASTTKLMTALLALERARPAERFAAPEYHPLPAESRIDLRKGERLTVRDLLKALLLPSANDAAVTIADGVSGSAAGFVADMNRRAGELGLADTSFSNPVGLDDPDNYSSARDLSRLAVRLMRQPRFERIVDLPAAELRSGRRRRVVANRNDLVRRFPFVDGIKTGHTIEAGHVLVGSATGRAGARVISVVLGEPSEAARDSDTLALLRYGLRQFRRVRPLVAGRPVARVSVEHDEDRRIALVPERSVRLTVRRGERVTTGVDAPEELEGPLPKGARVGSVTIARDGRAVREVDLLTADPVPGAGLWRRVVSPLGLPLTLLLLIGIVVAMALAGARRRPRHPRTERAGSR